MPAASSPPRHDTKARKTFRFPADVIENLQRESLRRRIPENLVVLDALRKDFRNRPGTVTPTDAMSS